MSAVNNALGIKTDQSRRLHRGYPLLAAFMPGTRADLGNRKKSTEGPTTVSSFEECRAVHVQLSELISPAIKSPMPTYALQP